MGSLYCADPIPAFQEDICANEEGRIIAVAIVRSDANVITDQTTLGTWQADIAAGRVIIIKNVRGTKPKSSAVDVDGFGRTQTISVSRDFTAQYFHPDVVGNEDFYNVLNYDRAHHFWYYTQGQLIWDSGDAFANFNGDHIVEEGLNTFIMFDVEVSWSGKDIPISFNASGLTTIFE